MSEEPKKQFSLSPNGWHAKLNSFVYGSYYVRNQRNFCPYFWGTLAAFPLSIIVALVKAANKLPRVNVNMPHFNFSHRQQKVITYSFVGILSVLGGIGIYEAITHDLGWLVLKWILIGAGPSILMRTALWTNRKYRNKHPWTPKPEKEPNMAVTAFKSWKDKNCPRINWK